MEAPGAPLLDLAAVRLGAKIDTVRVEWPTTRGPFPLRLKPGHDSQQGQHFTIQDPSSAELAALAPLGAPLLRLDIALDARPRRPDAEALATLFGALTRALWPFDAKTPAIARRYGVVGPDGKRRALRGPVRPDQTLYVGNRGDGAQLRCYLKTDDNREALPLAKQCARIELEITRPDAMGLNTVADLATFSWRRALGPYFRFSQPRIQEPGSAPAELGDNRDFFRRELHRIQAGHADRARELIGSGAVKLARADGGLARGVKVNRLTRYSDLNRRAGQALAKLGRDMSESLKRIKIDDQNSAMARAGGPSYDYSIYDSDTLSHPPPLTTPETAHTAAADHVRESVTVSGTPSAPTPAAPTPDDLTDAEIYAAMDREEQRRLRLHQQQQYQPRSHTIATQSAAADSKPLRAPQGADPLPYMPKQEIAPYAPSPCVWWGVSKTCRGM